MGAPPVCIKLWNLRALAKSTHSQAEAATATRIANALEPKCLAAKAAAPQQQVAAPKAKPVRKSKTAKRVVRKSSGGSTMSLKKGFRCAKGSRPSRMKGKTVCRRKNGRLAPIVKKGSARRKRSKR